MSNPIRFSIQIPFAVDRKAWIEKVRRADDLGFYSLSVPDHLGPSLPQFAPLVALASAASETERLRLAVTVLDNDFRHPVIVAKEIATLDLLSEGRVDMGMGAGWLEEDYTKTGVASWDSPGTRVDRLFESVGVLRELFTGEPVTHSGEHYRLRDFTSFPKPLQSSVPLMIGGRGKRLLSFAAKHAQIISVLAGGTGGGADDVTQFEEQLGWIAEAGGRERDDLVLGLRIPFGMLASPGQSARQAAEYFGAQRGQSADEVLASPFVLVGDHASIRDHLIEMREHFGITYITLSEEFALQLAPIISDLA